MNGWFSGVSLHAMLVLGILVAMQLLAPIGNYRLHGTAAVELGCINQLTDSLTAQ
jgi:hypothetical protein